MTPPFRVLPLTLALATLVIAACSDSGRSGGGLAAATLGTPDSPALDALASLIGTTHADDAQADVLIVDGDDAAPGSLAENPRVRTFLQSGRSVLFLDLSAEHATRDLVPLVRGTARGAAHAILARRALDAYGRPDFFVYAFAGERGTTPSAIELDAFRAGAERHFARATEPPTAIEGFDPPPGLLYVRYNFTVPEGTYEFTSTKDGADTSNGTQWTSVVANYRFTLLLENDDVASGDQQWLVAESFAEASPINSEKFSNQLMITKTGSGFVSCDIGWFQVELDSNVYPASQSTFDTEANEPQNTNQAETVNSRLNFGVGFLNPQGVKSSFGYTTNDSTTLTSWQVLNMGNGAVGLWKYQNQSPWIWNDPSKWDDLFAFGHGVDIAGSFLVPNALATDQVQADTKIVWSTGAVLTTQESFSTAINVTYLNVWAPAFGSIHYQDVSVPLSSDWTIDMQSVVPVAITGITFSQNPVDAEQVSSITGTVVLASPAPIDTIVYLTSDSDNATVPASVIVPLGESSTSFQIDVDANGLTPQEPSTVVNIQAFDALAAQAQLTVTRRR